MKNSIVNFFMFALGAAVGSFATWKLLNKKYEDSLNEESKSLKEMYSTISIEDRVKLEQEILNNPNLSEQLTYLRYNPEDSKKQTGEIVNYQAVYSKMMEKARENENSYDLGEK